MPASRAGAWFRDALSSVLNQTFRDIEVIVCDDSGGHLRADTEAAADARVRYVANAERLGSGNNHCQAIGLARGDYIAFLHDDDRWRPDYLAKAVAVLDASPAVGIALTGAIEVDAADAELGPRPTRMPAGLQADPLAHFLARDFMLMLMSLTLVRAKALEANPRPWPDVISGDITMYVDPVLAGWKVHYLAEPLVFYRTHPGQSGLDRLAHRSALITVWERYVFPEARHEQLRIQQLSNALIARAGAYLRTGDVSAAKADLQRARQVSPHADSMRWHALSLLVSFPMLAPPAAQLWSLVHNPFSTRHRGVG